MAKKYNVLIYGSGGREHALAWKIAQSPLLNKLFLALPNDGFKNLGEEIEFKNFEDLANKCFKLKIDLALIGPEEPLSKGLSDVFTRYGIKSIGPNKKWIRLESSKKFAKEFMKKNTIPTAKYVIVDKKEDIDKTISQFSTPPVIKSNGLAAGKGVLVSESFEEAKTALKEFLNGKFGEASSTVVVEEKLEGDELSVISFFDGKTLLPLAPARDYKRLLDGQKGPNTGGMGAYCPVNLSETEQNDLDNYLKKLESALKAEKADFRGIIYSGLMLTKDGIKVLEYNMRFGDPETQPLMYHLDSDLLEILIKASERKLNEVKLKWKQGTTIAVVLAAKGYPEKPKKGGLIKNIEKALKKNETEVFYAGVKKQSAKCKVQSVNNSLTASGGRVLAICANGIDIKDVRDKIYKTIDEIDFADKIFRKDIAM